MEVKIALAGNPNSGKTTMFNALTGSNQRVGNWPGVTVEKKEGTLKGSKDVIIQDLPGIYSLSPYTLEEVVARNYLVGEKPDAIINIVDGTNIERNLYLTTQLLELGIPTVVAVNMIDIVRKNGDAIDVKRLAAALGCEVMVTSALKGEGSVEVARRAAQLAAAHKPGSIPSVFEGSVEHAIAHIEESIEGKVDAGFLRWYAIKLFERDEKVAAELNLDAGLMKHIEQHIEDCEREMDDDSESIITNQRYAYIARVVGSAVKKKQKGLKMSASDHIDRVVTNRIAALPIFVVVMAAVYWIAMGPLGTFLTDWTNDVLVAEWAVEGARGLLEGNVADWLVGLVCDGIIAGVGAVIGFVPQMLILFVMLSILEDIGYMARIAFIMDRIFRKFGLSGKSFIPMLIGSGCGVPAVMASRTIENERDRRMTVMTTCFIPCGAKIPIISMIAGAFFDDGWWVATSAYFIGVAAIIISGIILKKLKAFAGEAAPFVMELPPPTTPRRRATSCAPPGSAAGASSSAPAPSYCSAPSSSGSCRPSASRTARSAWSRTTTTPSWPPSAARSRSSSSRSASAPGRPRSASSAAWSPRRTSSPSWASAMASPRSARPETRCGASSRASTPASRPTASWCSTCCAPPASRPWARSSAR